jgi:chromosome segregation ATPase
MTVEFWQIILVVLIPAAFSALAAWLTIRSQSGKVKADAADTVTKTALSLMAEYEKAQTKLNRRIEILEELITVKNGKIADLTSRVEALENVIDVKDGTIAERDAKITAQASQIATLQEQVRKLQCEVDQLRKLDPDWAPGDGDRRQA